MRPINLQIDDPPHHIVASANIRLITVLMRAPPNTSSLTNQNYCCPFLCDKAKFNCCFMTQNPIKNKNIWYILFVSMASFWNYPLFPPLCFCLYWMNNCKCFRCWNVQSWFLSFIHVQSRKWQNRCWYKST